MTVTLTQPVSRPSVKTPSFGVQNPDPQRMQALASQYPVVKTMFDLIDIPSATPQADPRFAPAVNTELNRMRTLLTDKFKALGVNDIEHEPNGSMIVKLPGSKGYENARPLMLTAHMDIVAGDPQNPTRPVQRTILQKDGREFIATDGTTTLGSDDKGGIAMILDTVARLQGKHPAQLTPLPHAPLEILFSPDEESSCQSLKTLDTRKFKAKNVLVVDEFNDFKVTTGLASAVIVAIKVGGIHGGHSGDDIGKPGRINANMVISEINLALGTGVIQWHPQYQNLPLISKNLGITQGGTAYNAIPEGAQSFLMLRSFDKQAQADELARIQQVLKQIEAKYQQIQPGFQIDLNITEEYPAWQADPNSPIPGWAKQAAKEIKGPKVGVGPIHAAAQASILANKTNRHGEPFDAALIGPHIEEAHTVRERIDWQSLVNASRWLGQIIQVYSRQAAQHAQP